MPKRIGLHWYIEQGRPDPVLLKTYRHPPTSNHLKTLFVRWVHIYKPSITVKEYNDLIYSVASMWSGNVSRTCKQVIIPTEGEQLVIPIKEQCEVRGVVRKVIAAKTVLKSTEYSCGFCNTITELNYNLKALKIQGSERKANSYLQRNFNIKNNLFLCNKCNEFFKGQFDRLTESRDINDVVKQVRKQLKENEA